MKKYLVLILVTISGLLFSCAGYRCLGQEDPREWGLMMHCGFGHGGMFIWIIFLIVIGLLIYFVVRDKQTKGPSQTQESPLDILKMRYAKGDVTREEYETMKKDLES